MSTARRVDCLLVGVGFQDHGLVFCRPDGTPYHPERFSLEGQKVFGGGGGAASSGRATPPQIEREPPATTVLGGSSTLQVVGESFYQDKLWAIVAAASRDRHIDHQVVACLIREPTNAYDPNAVAVMIDWQKVGHLSAEDAKEYGPGLERLEKHHGTPIGLRGRIVGGRTPHGSVGSLGVFLRHQPSDFGVRVPAVMYGKGLSDVSGLSDGWSGMAWIDKVPGDEGEAIEFLKAKLAAKRGTPVDRHFQYCEIEARLYRMRDMAPSALTDYDATVAAHDAEMDGIRAALLERYRSIPTLETYKQASIRHNKAHDYVRSLYEPPWV